MFEVTIADRSGQILLAFLGRRRVAGFTTGRVVTAAGTVGSWRGVALMMNPQYWLHNESSEVPNE